MGQTDEVSGSAFETLDDCRAEIDRIDGRLLELLRRRMAVSLRVGAIKKAARRPVGDPAREQALLTKLADKAVPPLNPDMVAAVWAPILAASRALQRD